MVAEPAYLVRRGQFRGVLQPREILFLPCNGGAIPLGCPLCALPETRTQRGGTANAAGVPLHRLTERVAAFAF